MTLRLGIDSEIFVRQARGGISRYFSALLTAFSEHAELGVSPVLLASRAGNEHLLEAHLPAAPTRRLRPTGPGLQRLLNGPAWSKDIYLEYRAGSLHRESIDILHATYWRPRKRELANAPAVVFTVYDLIPENLGIAGQSAHRGRREAFERADLIISISQATANQFAVHYPHLTHKVSVVPLGIDPSVFNTHSPGAGPNRFSYVLYVGTRTGHKNFWVLPAAMRAVRDATGCDVGLVMVGPTATEGEIARMSDHLPDDRFVFTSATDQELAQLYRSAEAIVLTSTMEGFGLPLLEGLACGTPTVASNIPPFQEVGQVASRYFSPSDVDQLAGILADVLTSPLERERMTEAGVLRAADLTWHHTAQGTAQAYLSILNGAGR